MQPLSTYSSLLTQNNAMINTSLLTTKLSQELSQGVKAVDLADNSDRQTILDLTKTKNDKESYVKSCTLGQIITAQYTVSLQHIEKVATTALKSVEGLMSASHGLPSSPSASPDTAVQSMLSQYSSLSQTMTQALNDMTISLNEQSSSGDGFLYSGLRNPYGIPTYTLPPVRDLNSLPYLSSTNGTAPLPADPAAPIPNSNPVANYPVNATTPIGSVDQLVTSPTGVNPGLPTYDADFGMAATAAVTTIGGQALPDQQTMAWGVQKLTIDTKETVTLNIGATAPAFQNLINGLRAAKTAADQAGNYSTADRDSLMSQAYSCLTRAISGGLDSYPNTNPATAALPNPFTVWDNGIRGLEQQNSLSELSIQSKSANHTADLSIINSRLDTLIGVDTTTVTVQLATANNQLQAAYKSTASLLSMSLLNYLK